MSVIPPKHVQFHFDNSRFQDPLHFPPYALLQVGDFASSKPYCCEEHMQRVHELTYIADGKAFFDLNGVRKSVKSGDVIFSPLHSRHRIESTGTASFRYYYIAFRITDTSATAEQRLAHFYNNAAPLVAVADKNIAYAFHDIFTNILHHDDFSDTLIPDAIRRLLVFAMRAFCGNTQWLYLPNFGSEKQPLLSQICSYIDISAEDIDALHALPEKFGYSYSYLSALFSKSMGITLRDYFLMRRHAHACELLQSGARVTEVSDKMGYTSVHAFCHAFAQREGISPGQYARVHRTFSDQSRPVLVNSDSTNRKDT